MTTEQRAVVDALDEIGFWLERELADSYRIQAYRNAARAIEALTAEQFSQLAAAHAWREVPGLGPSTAEVITQVVAGKVPNKLARLRQAGREPLAGGELIDHLKGDLHSHTQWSDGSASVYLMARTAYALGRQYQAITDHSPRLRVANGLSAERLTAQGDQIAEVQQRLDEELGERQLRILRGIEVDILADGSLDQSDAALAELDVVVASVHSGLRDDPDTMTKRMVTAVANRHTNVLGHCTGRRVMGDKLRPPSQFDAEVVFAACAQFDVAVEINSRPERCDPPDELIALALEIGCYFSIDTDAHAPGQLAFWEYGAQRAERLGVPAERIITTWDVDQLLAFCAKDQSG